MSGFFASIFLLIFLLALICAFYNVVLLLLFT